MSRKLLKNIGAERDANKVAERYIGSSDVLGDMQRDYGSALSGVRIHDDAAAAQRLDSVGRDGLASGRDVFMRPGLIGSGRADANGLFAHELAHVAQQDSGSVAYGSEQGGLLDWFRGWGKKKGSSGGTKNDSGLKTPKDSRYELIDGRFMTEADLLNPSMYFKDDIALRVNPSRKSSASSGGGGFMGWLRNVFGRKGDKDSGSKASASGNILPEKPTIDDVSRKAHSISNGKLPDLKEVKTQNEKEVTGSYYPEGGGDDTVKKEDNILSSKDSPDKDKGVTNKPEGGDDWVDLETQMLGPGMAYIPHKGQVIDPSKIGKVNKDRGLLDWKKQTEKDEPETHRKFVAELDKKYGGINYDIGNASYFRDEKINKEAKAKDPKAKPVHSDKSIHISGLNLSRIVSGLQGVTGADLSKEEIDEMVGEIASGRPGDDEGDYSDDMVAAKNTSFDNGMIKLKNLYYKQLKKLEATYGRMPTQMHPDDFLRQIPSWGIFVQNAQMVQDVQQMMTSAPKYFDFENNEQDKEMKGLQDYYFNMVAYYTQYLRQGLTDVSGKGEVEKPNQEMLEMGLEPVRQVFAESEGGVNFGPRFDEKQKKKYMADLKKRAMKEGWQDRLFGAFR